MGILRACFFNAARRNRQPDATVHARATAEQVRAALAHGGLRWTYQKDQPNERMFLTVNDAPDTVDYTICADTHHVSPADLAATVYHCLGVDPQMQLIDRLNRPMTLCEGEPIKAILS